MKRLFSLAACMLILAGGALGQAILDPALQQRMQMEPGPFQVIVTFKSLADVHALTSLGVSYLSLTTLPMSGAILTTDQINSVLGWENVASIYYNDQLQYFNHDAGQMTGAHYVQSTLGFKGRDITILVLDSGIDAAHPDLEFRQKVIENVKIVGDLGITGTTAFIEGVINTDNTSGHGTHVAGTAGGTGAGSASDERDPYYYRGVAPEASLVGLGAGEVLFILHALIGFDYAIANRDRFGVRIITNSWGNSRSQYDPNNPISIASYEAYRKGIVVTFAAGNGGPGNNTMSTYAINPWVIGVAAGTKTRDLAGFSSRGEAGDPFEHPDITAPGVSISSTRAPGTPVGALGPVVNLTHPEYYLYYHTISGTSMATPFVAGTVALMLDANPELSPDQIEEIILSTADPMAQYQLHQVGAGYIDVREAVERVVTTVGNRQQFLSGDAKWSSQGNWLIVEENNDNLGYFGRWRSESNSNASGGRYEIGTVRIRRNKPVERPLLWVSFFGTSIKLGYPTNDDGGTAEVLIDGISRGTISYYSDQPRWGVRSAYGELSNASHRLELRGLTGRIYVDNIWIDGALYPSNTQFVTDTTIYTGTMGPSIEGIPETHLIPFEVSDNTLQINAELGWTGGVDIDLYLLAPDGSEVASSASLDNPEELSYWVTTPGTYTYELVGYLTVAANYTLTSSLTRAVTTSSSPKRNPEEDPSRRPSVPQEVTLSQNYPNPFNPLTTISYAIPEKQFVRLKVYNLLGVEVALLVERVEPEGIHHVAFDASILPSGIYFYRLETGKNSMIRKMILLK